MRTIHVGASLAAVLLLSACKGTPTPPTPVVSSVTISSSTDLLKVRETVAFTATAVYSDGKSVQVTDWRSDTPAVATVDATTGRVTGVAVGTATVVATHEAMNATKLIRVVPDLDGRWKGEFRMIACSASGDWAAGGAWWNPCDAYSPIGPAQFEFSQNRDEVTGNVGYSILSGHGVLHGVGGPVAGTIDAGGHLKLTGVFINPTDKATNTLTADGNDLYIQGDRMAGFFKVDLTNAYLSGRARIAFAVHGDGLTKAQ